MSEWICQLLCCVLCLPQKSQYASRKEKNWNNEGKNSIFYAFFSVFTVFSLLCGHNFPFYARYTYTTGCVEWNKKNRFISLSDGDIYGWVLKSACAVHGEIRAPLLLLCWFGRNGIQIKQVDLGVVTLFRFLFIFFLSYPLLWFLLFAFRPFIVRYPSWQWYLRCAIAEYIKRTMKEKTYSFRFWYAP